MSIRSQATLLAGIVIAASMTVFADQFGPGTFELSWNTIDAGGGECFDGGHLELHVTIGQPDAGPVLTGGNIELVGGFWPAAGSGVEPCPADVNGDLIVSIADLLAVISNWGQTGPNPADVNNDGSVN